MYYLNDNGEILDEQYKTHKEAQIALDAYDDEDAYLISIVELSESDADVIRAIGYLEIGDDDKAELLKAISESENKDFVVKQFLDYCDADFFADEYFKHFQCAVVHGGYISGEEDFEVVELQSYADFLRKKAAQLSELIEQLDAEDNSPTDTQGMG